MQANQERAKTFLKIRESRSHELYLGAPSFSLRKKRVQFSYLYEKMIKKVESWGQKQFSKGGKEVLIKAVLQAIPTFAMGCFRIPTTTCREMESICARFWWSSSKDKNGIHWKSWDTLCLPKAEGGLGFRSFGSFNQALIAKQVWRILTRPDSLMAQVFKSRYFRNTDVLHAGIGRNPSFVWRSLCWGREIVRKGIGWIIANGHDIDAGYRD